MSRRVSSFVYPVSFAALLLAVPACSSSDDATTDAGGTDGGTTDGGVGAMTLDRDCTDAIDAVYASSDSGQPAFDASQRGAILKCAKDKEYTAAELEAVVRAIPGAPYTGKSFTSGAKSFRILYRTTRATSPVSSGYSSALVMLPTVPRASKMSMVVAAHGSTGQGPKCASSRFDPAGDYVKDGYTAQIYPMVGQGFPVIASDFAGYANFNAAGNPLPTYAFAEDLAYSNLDAARALRKLVGSQLNEKIFLTGHSQGGHATLATVTYADSYGADGTIAGVAVYAPNWVNQAVFGAFFLLANDYPIATSPNVPNATSIWYHYARAEMLDGAGKGLELFKEEKRSAIKTFVETACWSAKYPELEALGTTGADLYTTDFQNAVKTATGLGLACPTAEPGKSICEKWVPRYKADRPHLSGNAAKIPLLFLYGGKDTTIVPNRMVCGLDRLKTDNANVSVCIEPDANHGSIVTTRSEYVADWIANIGLGAPAPAACTKTVFDLKDENGAAVTCATPPPND